jgi:hypothetical protein
MKLRFDPSKPYGQVTPPYNGAVSFQDGYYFNAMGEPINVETGEVLSVEVKAPEPVVEVVQTITVGPEGVEKVEEDVQEVAAPIDPRAELDAWLRGKDGAETNWMKIRGYGREVFGQVAAGKDALVSLAIDQGFIPADQVKV